MRIWRLYAALGVALATGAGAATALGYWPALASSLLVSAMLVVAAVGPGAIKARAPKTFGRAVLVWSGLLLGAGVLAAYGEEIVIARKAEALAGERPYCLQSASQKDAFGYEPVSTLFDLNGLKMRARLLAGGSTMFRNQNHAFLVIVAEDRKEWLHWSYMQQAFVVIGGNRTANCAPAPHYVRKLPLW